MTAEYRERVVAFVDILGFSALVREADRNPELRQRIAHALRQVSVLRGPMEGDSSFRAQNFSDCIILTADKTASGLWRLLFAIHELTWYLLDIGVLVRGGVTIGQAHHDEEIVYGVGVLSAYELESKVADFPRVILDDSVVRACDEFAAIDEIAEVYRKARIARASDGLHYLDFFLEVSLFNRADPQNLAVRSHHLYVDGIKIRDQLQTMLDKSTSNPKVNRKIKWIAEVWNERVARPRGDNQEPLIGRIKITPESRLNRIRRVCRNVVGAVLSRLTAYFPYRR
ncbi:MULTISPECIES: hypothetical protein [Agrobacterium]|uniref:hypothetical protein n=1 Tax=Agrobacterium tumefaciens TaxID=358 RepID=UPI001571FCE4|nr:hypothetical protein [Agrobacterium tumefaciens]NSY46591.1 hypothetical protein [Agrobacterium tumefaciens]NSZ87548.1 hypothetical protein [Agrobacterium tumefaciens]WCA72554.1 hypothetical protein G6L97_25985 [Agrobacterium tumefaciens]